MPRIRFTPQLQRLIVTTDVEVAGTTVASALGEAFAATPSLKAYILDDQGRLRQHVAVFVDGRQIRDRVRLQDSLAADSEVYVAQALSGG